MTIRLPPQVIRGAMKLRDLRAVLQHRRFRPLRDEFYDGLWREAAAAVGAECMPVAHGLRRIARGACVTFVRRSELMLDAALTDAIFADKAMTYRLMAGKGLDVPGHRVFSLSTMADAEAFLEAAEGPVVVKPASGTGGGRGVTTGIATREALRQAARHAAGFDPTLLVEETLAGASYRLLYLDGELIDAVRRDPPVVVGDGERTVRELVAEENERRMTERPLTALSPLVLDHDAANHLAGAGHAPDSRPAAGDVVEVKGAINENAAAQNHSVRTSIHPEVVRAGGRLVSDLGVRFAGLDMMAVDETAPPDGGCRFTEINVQPGIHHHYLIARRQDGVRVAERVLEHIFTHRTGVMIL
jgi:D-alanine-D-alanine ligase-like ATP-grasp enzyme